MPAQQAGEAVRSEGVFSEGVHAAGGPADVLSDAAAVAGAGIVVLLGLMVTGGALFLVFPDFLGTALRAIRSEPGEISGTGACNVRRDARGDQCALRDGHWLAAGDRHRRAGPVSAACRLLSGVFYAGHLGLGVLGRDEVTRAWRLGSSAIALVVLMLPGLVPLLGQLLLFVLMLLGAGSLLLGR